MAMNVRQSLKDKENNWRNRNVVLPEDTEDTMEWTCEQRPNVKENGNKKQTCLTPGSDSCNLYGT